MFVIYGRYREIDTPIAYSEEEHYASQLADLLNASSLSWEEVRYDHITHYKTTHKTWAYPFRVDYIKHMQYVIKPDWIEFEVLTDEELARRKAYETSRTGKVGVLPSSYFDDEPHTLSRSERRENKLYASFRSRLRKR